LKVFFPTRDEIGWQRIICDRAVTETLMGLGEIGLSYLEERKPFVSNPICFFRYKSILVENRLG